MSLGAVTAECASVNGAIMTNVSASIEIGQLLKMKFYVDPKYNAVSGKGARMG